VEKIEQFEIERKLLQQAVIKTQQEKEQIFNETRTLRNEVKQLLVIVNQCQNQDIRFHKQFKQYEKLEENHQRLAHTFFNMFE